MKIIKKKEIKEKKSKFGKKQIFIVTADPFKQDILVIVNGQFDDAINFFKKHNCKENLEWVEKNKNNPRIMEKYIHNSGHARTYNLPVGQVMLLSHQDSWILTTEHVYHETLHAILEVAEKVGLELNRGSEEAFTYLQCYIAEKILKKIY